MCRWLAYYGKPVRMDEVLYGPQHSLIEQSLHSRLGAETTNGDGFGIGWYGADGDARPSSGASSRRGTTGTCASSRGTSSRASSSRTSARRRARAGAADQLPSVPATASGCGCTTAPIHDFAHVKRDLVLAVDPSLLPVDRGLHRLGGASSSSRSRFGLEDDPPAAVARAVGLIEADRPGATASSPDPDDVATTDGERLWAFRYSSERRSRSLFFSTSVRHAAGACTPRRAARATVDDETRIVVSEPLGELAGAWNEMPESSWGVVQPGQDELHPFRPARPRTREGQPPCLSGGTRWRRSRGPAPAASGASGAGA